MEFAPALVKLESSKRLCKNICRLLLRGNKFDPEGVVFDLLSGEVIVDLEMLRFVVKDRVIT